MIDCPTCGKFGWEPDEILRGLKALDWDDYYYTLDGDKHYDTPVGIVAVVSSPEGQEYDSYGGRIEDDVFVVIRVSDGRMFKREVSRDSYGSRNWSSEIREVKGQPRTITVFDYV